MPDEPSTSVPGNEAEAALPEGSALLRQNGTNGDATGKDTISPSEKLVAESLPLASLPMQLDVTVPVPGFRVQDLLALDKGVVLESRWPHTEDVPVWCGGVQLVWTEFEVVDEKLAVRVTRLG